MRTFLLSLSFVVLGVSGKTQNDSLFLRSIYNVALEEGEAYANLRSLCKDVGARLSGSLEAERAVEWGFNLLRNYPFDTVFKMPVLVPHWIRGDVESAGMQLKNGARVQFSVKTLGGSVSSEGRLAADVVEVKGFEQLELMGEDKVKGKIVFFNRAFDKKLINTGSAYGGCVNQRVYGASIAAELGAVGVLVRSMTHLKDRHAHTGSVVYDTLKPKIPALALSVEDADLLHNKLSKNKVAKVFLHTNAQALPDVLSHNVIAEIRGSETPENIITVGGHLDSWDVGEGAHDDGAGVVHSIEALRILLELGYKPKNTLRVVLFMNEENGNRGGKKYAAVAKEKGERHIAAIESDAGGFLPLGFSMDAAPEKVAKMKSWSSMLKPYQLYFFEKGWGGVDIGPLKEQGVPLIGLRPDSQRYFDFHHADTDVFENVHQRELELGCAAVSSLIYLIDQYGL